MPKLTFAERAILINQYRILSTIENDRNSYKDLIAILEYGYESEYKEKLPGFSEPFDETESSFVVEIMYLYYLMKLVKNKAAVDEPGGDRDPTGRLQLEKMEPKFPGFDGNKETSRLCFAEYLIADGRFPEHNHNLNSHGSNPNYEAMLDTWRVWGSPIDMTEAQVNELLKALD